MRDLSPKETHGGAMALVLAAGTAAWGPSSTNPPETAFREGCKANRVGGKTVGMLASAYLGLVAQSVGAIDPDVLCETFALLVEFHVFRKLLTVLSVCDERSADIFLFAGY
jgi:hypothetical protein